MKKYFSDLINKPKEKTKKKKKEKEKKYTIPNEKEF